MDTSGGLSAGEGAAGAANGEPAPSTPSTPCEQCGRLFDPAATIDRVWLQHRMRCAEGAKLMRELLARWRDGAARRLSPRG